MRKPLWGGIVFGVLIAGAALAQNPVAFFTQSLMPENAGAIVRSLEQSNQLSLTPYQPIPPNLDFPKIAVNVQFNPNTALLTTAGMTMLRDVATALQSAELSQSTFQVGAHLSANSGSAVSAQPLSQKRAQVVVEHLTVFYGIDQAKLVPMGYGQTSPLNIGNFADPQNERIEITNVDKLVP